MKKLKLNLQQFEGAEVLTRSQLKKIMGGDDSGSGGDCQARNEKCSSANHLNCCSGLVCAEFSCKLATAPAI
jgi:natural product precursor